MIWVIAIDGANLRLRAAALELDAKMEALVALVVTHEAATSSTIDA